MTTKVTRFSFLGGRAKPVIQELSIIGVNQYDARQLTFTVMVEGKEKPSHVMSLNIEDVPDFASMFKAALAQAKVAPDTTPAEARKKLDARKTKELAPTTSTNPSDMSVEALLKALQAQGVDLSSLKPKEVSKPVPDSTPHIPVHQHKAYKAGTEPVKAGRRGTTHSKPADVVKPATIPALDDLDEISTSELEAVSNIMAILLGKRGTK